MSIKNPHDYCKRIPTNVRFDADIKEFLIRKAHESGITLADYINAFIREKGIKGE